jgi:dephospho-CoA kinase
MPVIGITGGGFPRRKTTFSECLRELVPDATFFDADEAVHVLLDQPKLKANSGVSLVRECFQRQAT